MTFKYDFIAFKVDIFSMKFNIIVTDIVNDEDVLIFSCKSVDTRVITLLLHDVIHWKTATKAR